MIAVGCADRNTHIKILNMRNMKRLLYLATLQLTIPAGYAQTERRILTKYEQQESPSREIQEQVEALQDSIDQLHIAFPRPGNYPDCAFQQRRAQRSWRYYAQWTGLEHQAQNRSKRCHLLLDERHGIEVVGQRDDYPPEGMQQRYGHDLSQFQCPPGNILRKAIPFAVYPGFQREGVALGQPHLSMSVHPCRS